MVQGGLNSQAATMALVDGIGPKTVGRFMAGQIRDIEDLALADVDEVIGAVGGSHARAQKWINQAGEMVKTHGAYFFREERSEPVPTFQPNVSRVDPYRLRRAIGLRVATETTGKWVVSGGSENRRVVRTSGELRCDCPDYAKGNECKHILAVRLKNRDHELKLNAAKLGSEGDDWNAFRLWMDKDRYGLER
jgi:hypothetical protein